MGFRINTNIAAMSSHSSALMNNRNLDSSLGKLSSGLRINTAADDSSGLAIANSLRSQASSLGQAISNGNDAVGLLQTADGALSEYSNILDTIKTKAVQAASDGQNTASRLAIQKDIDALMEELDVIATTTSFNGQKLLSGTYTQKEFQMGANANESVKINIASTETSQIGQTTRATMEINKLGENQLTLRSATTGDSLTLDPIDLQYNNDSANGLGAVANQINKYSGDTGITATAVVQSNTGTISAGTTSTDFAINGINIGAIQVDANDEGGTLLNAINSKSTQTGVVATRTTDGMLELTSTDGRAIQVDNLSPITASTDADMSTFGKLDIVQAGSSDFQIEGAEAGVATGTTIELSSTMGTIEDSILTKGSTISTGSTLAVGTVTGVNISATTGMGFVGGSSTADMTLAINSILESGSKLNEGTVLTTEIGLDGSGTTALSSSMLLTAGSVLASGTVFDAGTVINQDMTIAGVDYKAGSTLVTDATFGTGEATTLLKDMTMFVDVDGSAEAVLGSGSTLAAGTVLGLDATVSGDTTLNADLIVKEGSVLVSGSIIAEGSTLGEAITLTSIDAVVTTTAETTLKAGSILGSASILDEGSTIGGAASIANDETMSSDTLIKLGSVLASGTILEEGTVLAQDLTADEVANGNGVGLKAGTVLGANVTLTADVTLTNDMTVLKDTVLKASSQLATNAGNRNSVDITNKEFTSLADIDVTTLDGAMDAIDTLSAAISNLDTIRSGIGSAQNQVVSTINNISVTQVNVKAAESQLRDVDFAAESANFSKFNILAQSGSYAMSQANAVQQNVMRLLQ